MTTKQFIGIIAAIATATITVAGTLIYFETADSRQPEEFVGVESMFNGYF